MREKSLLLSKISFLLSPTISHYLGKYSIEKTPTSHQKYQEYLVGLSNALSVYNAKLYTYCLQVSLLYLIPRMEIFY